MIRWPVISDVKQLVRTLQRRQGLLAEQNQHLFGQQTSLLYQCTNRLERSLFLQGRIAATQIAKRDRIRDLGDVEFSVSSQWGEDGIIEWLCGMIPNIPRSFVEFGVENFGEANCRFLMENRGWRGLVMDGNESYITGLRQQALYWRHDLTAAHAFITAENINSLITSHDFHGELGLLSVDIDGNDYWVLDAIDCVSPTIIICEINGVFGDLHPFTIPYYSTFQRFDAHYSGQYFGCSVAAARLVCERKGYTFIGTNTNGVNAFFVRNDVAGPIIASIEEIRAHAPRHRDSRDPEGELDFVRGLARYQLVAEMPVVDLRNDKIVTMHELEPLYSEQYLRDFQ